MYRWGDPEDIAALKASTYAALVSRFEAELADSGSLALVFMDGDGTTRPTGTLTADCGSTSAA